SRPSWTPRWWRSSAPPRPSTTAPAGTTTSSSTATSTAARASPTTTSRSAAAGTRSACGASGPRRCWRRSPSATSARPRSIATGCAAVRSAPPAPPRTMLDLVTGSSGLLGSCLVERLLARGRRVRALDLVPPPDVRAVEFVHADLRDAPAVVNACRGVEVVYHLAAGQRMKPQFAGLSEPEIYAMNVAAVEHVVAAALASGVRKLVAISSSGVDGIPRTVPCGEDPPQRPLGAYGRSKIEAEHRCQEALARGLDVTLLRPMSLFGPRMTGVFVLLFDWVRQGKNVYLLGAGTNRVQMVSAWDVADACLLAAERPASRGAVLNLGADDVPTVRAQVEALIAHSGSRSRVVPLPA